MTALLANAGPFWGYGLADIAIGVVIFFAIVALVYIALVYVFEMPPPPWIIKAFWVVIGAVLIVLGIKFVASIA